MSRDTEVNCEVVAGRLGRWRDGELAGTEVVALEEHLVLCPPCLALHTKLSTALAALAAASAAPVPPPAAMVGELGRLLSSYAGKSP
jgi:hypothetical protein